MTVGELIAALQAFDSALEIELPERWSSEEDQMIVSCNRARFFVGYDGISYVGLD